MDGKEYPKGKMELFKRKIKIDEKGREAIASIISNEEACLLSHPKSLSNPHVVARDRWVAGICCLE